MQITKILWTEKTGWQSSAFKHSSQQLIFLFGQRRLIENGKLYSEIREAYKNAIIVGCSTGGNMSREDITDEAIIGAVWSFDNTTLKIACCAINDYPDTAALANHLGQQLHAPDLAGIILLSDGLMVNGSALVAGVNAIVGDKVPLFGGLAGDGADFQKTVVMANDLPQSGIVTAVGLYGANCLIGTGSASGWDAFGPHRKITRAENNILYELDGKPALDLYEKYLGEEASGLPGSALLFPLRISAPGKKSDGLIRTVLGIDHQSRSMTFAGDMPVSWTAQLMRGELESLMEGAEQAAVIASASHKALERPIQASLMVSCIGRRLLMGQRTFEEIDAAHKALGQNVPILGFYSYGEISASRCGSPPELHNQTMTIMTISESTV